MTEISYIFKKTEDIGEIRTFEIKECPCCGAQANFICTHHKESMPFGFINCHMCSVGMTSVMDIESSIMIWNKRDKE